MIIFKVKGWFTLNDFFHFSVLFVLAMKIASVN